MRWVTERRPHVDRCASGWFVRRFVDRRPTFIFIARGDPIPRGAVPYDLPGVELGHHGSRVTFDAFLRKHRKDGRRERALRRIADLVRDIDLAAYREPESHGLDSILQGILLAEASDLEVYRAAFPLFDALHRCYSEDGGD